jgi:hypothetical protein
VSAVADKLREARALIERGWTQGHFARDEDGYPEHEGSPDAVCWCAMGAMSAADPNDKYGLYGALSHAIGDEMVGMWNDRIGRTKAEVLAAFDKAIALAESAQ